MTLRVGWLSPFTGATGVGTFSKLVTDAMPDGSVDLTIIAPKAACTFETRHRIVHIESIAPDSQAYDLFDILIYNIGNNTRYHREIFETLRNHPGIVICHDYVYQHFLAAISQEKNSSLCDYVALTARYGTPEALAAVRRSNLTGQRGLRFGPWDSELCASEPLAAPLLHLGSALVVHSAFAETYAQTIFAGPVLRLGLPGVQRPKVADAEQRLSSVSGRLTLVSFGYVQSTKCIHDVLIAMSESEALRGQLTYVVAGFIGDPTYVERLRGIVREHRLASCVRFAFDLSDDELAELSDQADAFINLRYPNTEGASASLIEQLETGKPVIIINSGCYEEVPSDAALKVPRPHDVPALQKVMLELVENRGRLSEIGARGRAFARRYDSRGYVDALLDFIQRENLLVRRRAAEKAMSTLGSTPNVLEPHPDDDGWSAALGLARTTFDLIDRGHLAKSPAILRELAPRARADYVHATLVRDVSNFEAYEALNAYLSDKEDALPLIRMLEFARDRWAGASPEARELFMELCPRDDISFWRAVAALGPDILEPVAHHAFFGSQPPELILPGQASRHDTAFHHACLGKALNARAKLEKSAFPEALSALVNWLSRVSWEDDVSELDPIEMGAGIAIGSDSWDRFVRLRGFHKPELDHAWSGKEALILFRLPREAGRVQITGHSLHGHPPVEIFASTNSPKETTSRMWSQDARVLEFDVPNDLESDSMAISLSISPCYSPLELGHSIDPRPLGFCFRYLAVA